MILTFVDAIAETPTQAVAPLELKVPYLQETLHIGKRRSRKKAVKPDVASQVRLLLQFHHCPRFLEVVFDAFPRAKQPPLVAVLLQVGVISYCAISFIFRARFLMLSLRN